MTTRSSDRDPDTDEIALKVSEIFSSIQGEGPSAGEPCVFLRLALCNLRCGWCDTKYTWDFAAFRYEEEVRATPLDAVAEAITGTGAARLVITGGEPLMQQKRLARLLDRLPASLFIEMETNGTLLPDGALLERINQWNVSPKLANSGEPEERRLRPRVLETLSGTGRAWLKLVITGPVDMPEVDALIDRLAWPSERVLLMPEGARKDVLAERMPHVAAAALRRGYRVSPRLHVERFDGKRGY